VYLIIGGGGKVGANLTATLVDAGHEVTLIERNPRRVAALEERLGGAVRAGDVTELRVLERAGIERADLLVAVTGDDEDNLIMSQVAKEKYGVPKVIARVNDPRNQPHFDMLGIGLTVSATATLLGLVEHELPEHELVTLLDMRREGLEIVEFGVAATSPMDGRAVRDVRVPEGSRLISLSRGGASQIVEGDTVLHAGDLVLAILEPGVEDALRALLAPTA
jgi:trk system potassium uptake protein